MKVSVIGAGHVGLVSGVCLAEQGHDVVCVDVDPAKVALINAGTPPIHEKGLEDLLRRNLSCRFRATTDLRDAVLPSDISLITVGTPFAGDDIDLSYIRHVARQIGAVLEDKPTYHCVAVKSTVLPGTTEEVVLPLLESTSGKKAGRDFGVGMNPEFLREGEAVQDFLHPDRIVMGGSDRRAIDALDELYRPFPGVDKIRTNPRTAETIKYTSNALLATMISFSNEIANLCTSISDVDVVDVMRAVHLDRRLSPILADGTRVKPSITTYLEAGCGFGGSCFPKDIRALIAHGRKAGNTMQLLDAVMSVNDRQPYKVIELLRQHFPDLAGVRVSVLGLAFKPGTDDVRESPALPIISELVAGGALVRSFDPIAGEAAQRALGIGLDLAPDLDQALRGAQAVLVLTRWEEFNELPRLLAALPEPPVLIDARRMLDRDSWHRYEGIGFSRKRVMHQDSASQRHERLSVVPVATSELCGGVRRAEGAHAAHDIPAMHELVHLLDLVHETVMERAIDGTIRFWNRGAEEMYGWKSAEAVGHVSHALLRTEFPQPLEQIDAELVNKGQWEGNLIHVRRDGTRIAVKSRWAIRADDLEPTQSVVEVNNSILLAVVPVATSELRGGVRRAEGAHAAHDIPPMHELVDLLDLVHETVMERAIDGTIRFWNRGAEEMYGWKSAEAVGHVSHALLRTEFPQPLEQIDAELVNKGQWEGNLIHVRRDGTRIAVKSRWAIRADDLEPTQSVLEVNNSILAESQKEVA